MSKVAFLTDSSCDIPADLAEKYGIEIACFPVNLDGKEYIERRDMTNDEFYQMMREASGCPTTAAITSLQWLEFYTRFADEGYTDVVHASINAGGSSTYANALTAAKMLAEERPGCQMKIRLAHYGDGFDPWHCSVNLLHFLGKNILSAGNDHFILAPVHV